MVRRQPATRDFLEILLFSFLPALIRHRVYIAIAHYICENCMVFLHTPYFFTLRPASISNSASTPASRPQKAEPMPNSVMPEAVTRKVTSALENCGLQLFHRPNAGMFLWARFAADIDTAEVAQQATDQGLLLAPGKLFVTGDQPNPWLRFNVAHSDHAQVYRFLERIAAGKA